MVVFKFRSCGELKLNFDIFLNSWITEVGPLAHDQSTERGVVQRAYYRELAQVLSKLKGHCHTIWQHRFIKSLKVPSHQLNSKTNDLVLLSKHHGRLLGLFPSASITIGPQCVHVWLTSYSLTGIKLNYHEKKKILLRFSTQKVSDR